MFCSGCGNEMDEQQAFCPRCGTPNPNNKGVTPQAAKGAKSRRGFQINRIEDIVSLIACVLAIISLFMPVIKASFLGFSESLSFMSEEVDYVGVLGLIPALAATVLLILGLRIPFLIAAVVELIATMLLSYSVNNAVKESYGLGTRQVGYYLLIIAAIVMLIGAILKLVIKTEAGASAVPAAMQPAMTGVSQSISRGLNTLNEKTSDFLEENKIKTYISTLESKMNTSYNLLGGNFYARWKSGDRSNDLSDYMALLNDLKDNEALIEGQRAKIDELHAKQQPRTPEYQQPVQMAPPLQTDAGIAAEETVDMPSESQTVGTTVELCPSCGAPRVSGSVFCNKCGAKFS